MTSAMRRVVFSRLLISRPFSDKSPRVWLEKKGYDSQLISEILHHLQKNGVEPSVTFLSHLGDQGLKDFVDSIDRVRIPQDRSAPRIQVSIEVPHIHHRFSFTARVGQNLKECAEENEELATYLECACGGIAACSTCHVYVPEPYFSLMDPPEEAELDMLDLASYPSDYSRLGCQLHLNENCDEIVFQIPREHLNLFGR